MTPDEQAAAAVHRIDAVKNMRLRLQQLGETQPKTNAEWAEVSELKLLIGLAYDGAQVHATLALYGAVQQLAEQLPVLSLLDARERAAELRRYVQTPHPARDGMTAQERRQAAQHDARPEGGR